MHVIETDRHLGVPFASGDGGQKEARQYGDDGYDDKKFNQREGPVRISVGVCISLSSWLRDKSFETPLSATAVCLLKAFWPNDWNHHNVVLLLLSVKFPVCYSSIHKYQPSPKDL